ncbi:MAG: hypothetical protein DRQ99_19995 [Candidatus Parabeggiatoa sp. nov. 3]|nr:MAG: hypothetical protein DRQ99_19995 [Gammaproteobacteria bacterium]
MKQKHLLKMLASVRLECKIYFIFAKVRLECKIYFREGAIGVQNLFCIVNLNGGQAGTRFWVCLNSSLVRCFWVFLNLLRTAIPPYIDLKL